MKRETFSFYWWKCKLVEGIMEISLDVSQKEKKKELFYGSTIQLLTVSQRKREPCMK